MMGRSDRLKRSLRPWRAAEIPALAAEMGRRGAERARRYTWSFAAARLRRVYADLAIHELVACS